MSNYVTTYFPSCRFSEHARAVLVQGRVERRIEIENERFGELDHNDDHVSINGKVQPTTLETDEGVSRLLIVKSGHGPRL